MNMVDFQEKMDPNHRALLCRMLNMKELPERLLEEYQRVKTMVDRIDGFLGAGELAVIARMSGFGPNTGKFPMTGKEAEAEILSGAAEIVGSLDAADDKQIEEALKQSVEELRVQPIEQAIAKPTEQGQVSGTTGQAVATQAPDKNETFWSRGMPVKVLQADDLLEGTIVNVQRPEPGSGKAVQLTVRCDNGETVTVDEGVVEAV